MLGIVSVLAKLAPVVTPVIGKLLRGPNAKGHAGGAVTGGAVAGVDLMGAFGGLFNAFATGFSGGLEEPMLALGTASAEFLASYIVGFAVTWLTANKAEA